MAVWKMSTICPVGKHPAHISPIFRVPNGCQIIKAQVIAKRIFQETENSEKHLKIM